MRTCASSLSPSSYQIKAYGISSSSILLFFANLERQFATVTVKPPFPVSPCCWTPALPPTLVLSVGTPAKHLHNITQQYHIDLPDIPLELHYSTRRVFRNRESHHVILRFYLQLDLSSVTPNTQRKVHQPACFQFEQIIQHGHKLQITLGAPDRGPAVPHPARAS